MQNTTSITNKQICTNMCKFVKICDITHRSSQSSIILDDEAGEFVANDLSGYFKDRNWTKEFICNNTLRASKTGLLILTC